MESTREPGVETAVLCGDSSYKVFRAYSSNVSQAHPNMHAVIRVYQPTGTQLRFSLIPTA